MALRILLAFCFTSFIGLRGYRKGSLDVGGAVAAAVVGGTTLAITTRFGASLLLFYFSSSALTKMGARTKAKVEEGHAKESQRGMAQVLSCSVTGVAIAVLYRLAVSASDQLVDYKTDYLASFLLCAYLGFFACCNGDTWASEVGTLSRAKTATMITTLAPVPKGTNGGVTVLGTGASIAGGLFIGFVFWVCGLMCAEQGPPAVANRQWLLVPFGGALGALGSLVDSIMGATLQESWVCSTSGRIVKPPPIRKSYRKISGADILNNEQVNLASATLVSLVGGIMGEYLL